ncbi:MAG: TonB-dependent receptor, partial [Bacteroidota bacterium]
YYRDLEGQVVNRNFARLLVNQRVETEVLPAIGQAYGGEFSLNFQIRKWEVKSAYVYSRSLQRTPILPDVAVVNGGEWFPSDFDAPHNITITAIWKARKSVTYSLNFVYRTGRPVSVPVGVYPIFPSFQVPAFSERNQYRIPDYHRLDISATFDRQVIKRSRSKSEVVLSLYNLYGRNNPFSVYFQRGGGGFEAYQLSVLGAALPMLSYNFRF